MPYRIQKINHLIREEISEMLQRNVKDPRLGNFIGITDVNTSPDLKLARVFVSFYGTEEEKKQAMLALDHAKGFFKHELGDRLRMRTTPDIVFQWDDSIERGNRLITLMEQVDKEPKPVDASPAEETGSDKPAA